MRADVPPEYTAGARALDSARIGAILASLPDAALPELRLDGDVAWWGGLGFHLGRGYDHVGHEIEQLLAAEAARRLEDGRG